MNQNDAMNGACLCGGVTWATNADVRSVLECHCERCQRLTGNYMAATAAPTDQLDIIGDDLRWYSPVGDSNVAYGFCSTCGSTLFFRSGITDDTNALTSMCAGSVNGPSGLLTTEIWFADRAADHVRIDRDPNATVEIFGSQPPASLPTPRHKNPASSPELRFAHGQRNADAGRVDHRDRGN
ncbi:MAG: hypothetical protein ACI8V4_003253 [Ilumatobacter sp.]|jgi:hypothetical protein